MLYEDNDCIFAKKRLICYKKYKYIACVSFLIKFSF